MFHRPGFSALNTDICWAEYERVKEFLPVNPKHINVGAIGRVAFDDTPLSTCIKAALGTLPEPHRYDWEATLP